MIVGSGPAGYTAGIYAARAQLAPVLYEGSVTAGGALMNTTEVENFPGFPAGIIGPDLMDNLKAQAEKFGTTLVRDDIVEMQLNGDVKVLKDGSGNVLRAKAVILATGSAYKEIGLENEKRLSGRGVSWCATCDGFFFRNQEIAVVGGGDSALDEGQTYCVTYEFQVGQLALPPQPYTAGASTAAEYVPPAAPILATTGKYIGVNCMSPWQAIAWYVISGAGTSTATNPATGTNDYLSGGQIPPDANPFIFQIYNDCDFSSVLSLPGTQGS